MTEIVFKGNDTLFEIEDLKDIVADSFLNAATVQLTLKDKDDVDVAGHAWPVVLGFVAGSNGNYQGVVDKAVTVVVGEKYTAVITMDEGGIEATWRIPVRIEDRVS